MRSLKESLILELSSELLARAHDKQVARNGGKESNRSRRFATAAGKALTRELLSGKRGGTIVNTAKELSTNSSFMSAALKDEVVITNNINKETKINIPEDDDNGFYIPNGYMKNEDIYLTGGAKRINARKNKFYIYRDMYHSCLHIACADDIKCNIGYNYNHYEDFSQKDILGEYDTVYDAVIAALKMVHKNITDEDIAELKNVEDEYDDAFKYSKFIFQGSNKILGRNFYDSNDFVIKVLKGEYDDEDCLWSQDWYSILSTMNDYANVYDKEGHRILSDGTIDTDE